MIQEYKVFNEEEQEKSRSKDENMLNQSAIKLIEEKLEKLSSDITDEGNKLKELTKRYEAKFKNIDVENHPKIKRLESLIIKFCTEYTKRIERMFQPRRNSICLYVWIQTLDIILTIRSCGPFETPTVKPAQH